MHYATLQIMHYANWHYNAILKMHFASAIENAFPSSRNAFYKNGSVSVRPKSGVVVGSDARPYEFTEHS